MAWKFANKPDPSDALWMRCDYCESLIYKKVVEEKQNVCPECGWHFTLNALQRVDLLLDAETFEERYSELESLDPLEFRAKKSYRDKLRAAVKAANRNDCAIVGTACIDGVEVVCCIIDPTFIMGAMGSVTGEKIARGAELARELKRPYVLVSGSGGGARMEEGVCSLMQMAKTSAALGRLRQDGGLYVVVLTNATMGGSMASFASLGDVIVAEPLALLGFTGPRVIRQTIKKEMPEGFQRSEFLLEHGFVDQIVPRDELKARVAYFLRFFGNNGSDATRASVSKSESEVSQGPADSDTTDTDTAEHTDDKAASTPEPTKALADDGEQEATTAPHGEAAEGHDATESGGNGRLENATSASANGQDGQSVSVTSESTTKHEDGNGSATAASPAAATTADTSASTSSAP